MKAVFNAFVLLLMGSLLVFGVHLAVTAGEPERAKGGVAIAVFSGTLLVAVLFWLRQEKRAARRAPSKDVHERVAFKRSKGVNLVTAAFCAMLAVSFYLMDEAGMISDRRSWLLPAGMWTCLGIAVAGLAMATRAIAFVLSPDGLQYDPFKVGLIPWRDIRGLKIKSMGRMELIVLDVTHPNEYLSSHPVKRLFRGLDRKTIGSEFAIMPALFGERTELIADEIRNRIRAFRLVENSVDSSPGT